METEANVEASATNVALRIVAALKPNPEFIPTFPSFIRERLNT
jgi:hypothetical protein